MIGKIVFLAALVLAQGKPHVENEYERNEKSVRCEHCPEDQRHYLLPHEYDCTKFYYCEYGMKWELPRDCAPGTHFSFELQVCIHPTVANCTLPGSPTEPTTTTTTSTPAPTTTTTTTTPAPTTTTTTTTPAPTTTTTTTTPAPTTTTTTTTPAPTTTTTTTTPAPTTTTTTTTPAPNTTTTITTTPAPTTTTTTTTPAPNTTTTTTTTLAPTTTTTTTTPAPNTTTTTTTTPAPTTTTTTTTPAPNTTTTTTTTLAPNTTSTTSKPTTTTTTSKPTTTTTTTTTASPDSDEDLLENGCPADFDVHMLLPHETKCNKFYYCVYGQKVERQCAPGTYFNAELQVCDWPENVDCSNFEEGEDEEDCEDNDTDGGGTLPNGCPADFDVHKLLPHESDCSKFYYCVFGEKVERSCAPGTLFNPELQVCDWPINVNCTTNGNPPDIDSGEGSGDPDMDTDDLFSNDCPSDFDQHKLLPHETECNKFYQCVFGEKVERECAPGTYFNPELEVCDWPHNVECPGSVGGDGGSGGAGGEDLPNGCPADFDIHKLLPHETNCSKFYYCVFGEKVERECPLNTHFNPTLQVCDWPENAGCANTDGDNGSGGGGDGGSGGGGSCGGGSGGGGSCGGESGGGGSGGGGSGGGGSGGGGSGGGGSGGGGSGGGGGGGGGCGGGGSGGAGCGGGGSGGGGSGEGGSGGGGSGGGGSGGGGSGGGGSGGGGSGGGGSGGGGSGGGGSGGGGGCGGGSGDCGTGGGGDENGNGEGELLPNGCPSDFDIHKLLPHEKDCNKFYYCVFGEKVERTCAPGTHFNPLLQVCDWPENAGCATNGGGDGGSGGGDGGDGGSGGGGGGDGGSGGGGDGDGGSGGGGGGGGDGGSKNKCETGCNVLPWPHENDCDKFWRCDGSTAVLVVCSEGLHFNPKTLTCDFTCNVSCSRRGVESTALADGLKVFLPWDKMNPRLARMYLNNNMNL